MILFTSPSCPNCPAAKKLVEERKLDCEIINAQSDEGYFKAIQNNVMNVPTFILNGEKYSYSEMLDYLDSLDH